MILEAIEALDVIIDDMTEYMVEMSDYIWLCQMTGPANMIEAERQEFRARQQLYDGLVEEREVLIKYLG
tara:strand:+ start:9 stop:215 length:207 start_codon:yes stop_codon:yes gene_type:complete